MQKDAAQTLYSASDLCHFVECQYLTVLDAQHLLTPMTKTPDAEEAVLIQKNGHEHEARYLRHLSEKGLGAVNIHDLYDSLDMLRRLPADNQSLRRRGRLKSRLFNQVHSAKITSMVVLQVRLLA